MTTTTVLIQTASISTALLASGAIATLSLFDVPMLQSQKASHSLPSIRWLFSRGSHIFPQAAFISSAGLVHSAYSALPQSHRSVAQLLRLGMNGTKVNGFLLAAALTISIAPFTSLMIPTNFELIAINEEKGGARSAKAVEARASAGNVGKARSAEESVKGKDDINELTDLSRPQEETSMEITRDEDKKVRALLDKFKLLNGVRALLMSVGGVLGLLTALAV